MPERYKIGEKNARRPTLTLLSYHTRVAAVNSERFSPAREKIFPSKAKRNALSFQTPASAHAPLTESTQTYCTSSIRNLYLLFSLMLRQILHVLQEMQTGMTEGVTSSFSARNL